MIQDSVSTREYFRPINVALVRQSATLGLRSRVNQWRLLRFSDRPCSESGPGQCRVYPSHPRSLTPPGGPSEGPPGFSARADSRAACELRAGDRCAPLCHRPAASMTARYRPGLSSPHPRHPNTTVGAHVHSLPTRRRLPSLPARSLPLGCSTRLNRRAGSVLIGFSAAVARSLLSIIAR